jgi:hypothetical protein
MTRQLIAVGMSAIFGLFAIGCDDFDPMAGNPPPTESQKAAVKGCPDGYRQVNDGCEKVKTSEIQTANNE